MPQVRESRCLVPRLTRLPRGIASREKDSCIVLTKYVSVPAISREMPSETSLHAHKRAFLTTQIRCLGAPLILPSTEITLPASTLDKILTDADKKIKAHNLRVFGVQSQSHVAEQIDTLYQDDVLSGGLPSRKAETCVRRQVDFTDSKDGITNLPESWSDALLEVGDRTRKKRRIDRDHEDETASIDQEDENVGEEAELYDQLHARLSTQIEHRDQLRLKLVQIKKLLQLLEPFDDPKADIQPNLTTKDNTELETELSKMRILMAKLGSTLQRQKLQGDPASIERRNDPSEKQSLEQLLRM